MATLPTRFLANRGTTRTARCRIEEQKTALNAALADPKLLTTPGRGLRRQHGEVVHIVGDLHRARRGAAGTRSLRRLPLPPLYRGRRSQTNESVRKGSRSMRPAISPARPPSFRLQLTGGLVDVNQDPVLEIVESISLKRARTVPSENLRFPNSSRRGSAAVSPVIT
jgi:hypothetical protein